MLATSREAQDRFRALHERWVSTPPSKRAPLAGELARFVQSYPNDPKSRLVRLYLAWLALRDDDEGEARRWLALATRGAPSVAEDLAGVVRAALWLRDGDAERAYTALYALSGQLIDGDDRLLCLDELVSAALGARRYPEAVEHMLALAAQAARRHRERVWSTLEPRLAQVPIAVLEQSLETLGQGSLPRDIVSPSEYAAARAWMRGLIRELLSRSALVERDVDLAQRLVAAPRVGELSSPADRELMLLATQGPREARVEGRRLGLALDLTTPTRSERSLQVSTGISEALAARAAEDAVELATRRVDALSGTLAEVLARLAGDGAGVLVAGVDAESAKKAAEFAARERIPTLLLHEPEGLERRLSPFSFVVGAAPDAANALLRRQLSERGVEPLIGVGSETWPCPKSPADPLPAARATLLDRRPGASGLFFEAGPRCTRDVLMQLDGAQGLVIALGLETLSLADEEIGAAELWAVSAGSLPVIGLEGAPEGLAAWVGKNGRGPTFFQALGRDAAQLARVGLSALEIPSSGPAPSGVGAGRSAARALHQRARDALAKAALADLWTSDAQGFAGQRLPRQFTTVRVGRGSSERRAPQPLR